MTNGADAQNARAWVYFIEAEGTGLVKIGFAKDPKRRLYDLSTMSPVPLVLLATIPGGRERETQLHRMLDDFRHHGEWFHRSKMVDDLIATAETPLKWVGLFKKRETYLFEFLASQQRNAGASP